METVKAFDLEVAKTKGASGEWDQTDGQSRLDRERRGHLGRGYL